VKERKDLKFFSCCSIINHDMLNFRTFFALSENANKSIKTYWENTPIDIKLILSLVFTTAKKRFILYFFLCHLYSTSVRKKIPGIVLKAVWILIQSESFWPIRPLHGPNNYKDTKP
jgi:hypothetical protein